MVRLFNVIDILTIFPSYFTFLGRTFGKRDMFGGLKFFRVLRVLRIFKLGRYLPGLQVMLQSQDILRIPSALEITIQMCRLKSAATFFLSAARSLSMTRGNRLPWGKFVLGGKSASILSNIFHAIKHYLWGNEHVSHTCPSKKRIM